MSNKLTLAQIVATTEALRALARPVGGDIPEQHQRLGVGPAEIIDRARLYLKTIPGAVSGQGGHNRTFFVANRLVRGFDIRPAAALPLFQEWNEKCVPPWPEEELERKLAEADRQPGPRGFLLATSRPVGTAAAHTVGADGNPAPVFRNFVWDEISDGNTWTARATSCG